MIVLTDRRGGWLSSCTLLNWECVFFILEYGSHPYYNRLKGNFSVILKILAIRKMWQAQPYQGNNRVKYK
jgi:hypothetical protein